MIPSLTRPLGLVLTGLATTVFLAACAASDQGASMPISEPMAVGEAAMPAMDMPAMDSALAETGVTMEKSIITSGTMALDVSDVAKSTSDLRLIVAEAQGQVDQDSETVNPDEPADRIADLTIRVPADSFTTVLERIEGLGVVTSRSISRSDVTIQVVDVEARIKAIESSIVRLQSLIDQATSTADLIEAENALTARQAELDSLRAQQAYLADQVGMSTLQVSLRWEESAGSSNDAIVLLVVGLILGIGIGLLAWLITALIRRSLRPARPGAPVSS